MKRITRVFFAVLAACWTFSAVSAQVYLSSQPQSTLQSPQEELSRDRVRPGFLLKTNLLYDLTTTLNLGAEFRLGPRVSLDFPVNFNPWTFSNNRKWKHIMAQPGVRIWGDEGFAGHFWSFHLHGAYYNVGNLPDPFSEYMKSHRFEGWLAGGGLSYGHRWILAPRWALEAEAGIGYAFLSYDQYDCIRCGDTQGSHSKNYFGPTKVALNLVLDLGRKTNQEPEYAYYSQQTIDAYAAVSVVEPSFYESGWQQEQSLQGAQGPGWTPDWAPVSAPVLVYDPLLAASFIAPNVDVSRTRSETAQASLNFTVGNAEIVSTLRNNATELRRMHELLEYLVANPDASIDAITITGHASPEGHYEENFTLSERRATNLRNHLLSIHGLRGDLFETSGAGEDWAMLDAMVEASKIPDRYRVLEIIRNDDYADTKQNRLMTLAHGEPYRQMTTEFFPRLRRADLRIDYTLAPISIERGRELLTTHPERLSLEDLLVVAGSYDPGSFEFNEVFRLAARLYPDSDMANMNAAASALDRRDASSAAYYLYQVKDHTPEYYNNMGVLSWLIGDKGKAVEYFSRGGAQGVGNAAELSRHSQSAN